MQWQVEWGPQVTKLLEIEQATGSTPQALLDKPVLYGHSVEVAMAYNVLAARRSSGFAPNPISLSDINAYMDRYGEPSIPVDVFIDLVGAMDLKYLELSNGNKPTGKR